MAAPTCTFCEQNQGVYMGTDLTDGDTQIACGQCLPAYALGMAAVMTQGMTREAADAYGDTLDAIYANDPRKPPQPPPAAARRPRKGKPADTPEAATDAASVPDAEDKDECPACGDMFTVAELDAHQATCGTVTPVPDGIAG